MADQYKLVFWKVVTDRGEYDMTEKQLEGFLSSESSGARFFRLDNVVINIAFVKEIYRKVETRDTRFSTLTSKEKRFLASEDKYLPGN